jgi:hypothetical protein
MTTLLAGDVEGDDANLPEVHLRIPYSQHLSLRHVHHLQNLHTSVSNKLHEVQSLEIEKNILVQLLCKLTMVLTLHLSSLYPHTLLF